MTIYGYICKNEKPDFEFFVKTATDDMGRPIVQVTTLESGLVVIPVSIYQPPVLEAQAVEPAYAAHDRAAEAHAIASEYAGQGFPTGTPDHIISEFRELAEKHSKLAVSLSAKLGMLNMESVLTNGYDHYGLHRRHKDISKALKN